MTVSFKAESSALWIAGEVYDLPSGIAYVLCGARLRSARRYPYVAIHFRCL